MPPTEMILAAVTRPMRTGQVLDALALEWGGGISKDSLAHKLTRMVRAGLLERAGGGQATYLQPVGWRLGLPEEDMIERRAEHLKGPRRAARRSA